MSTSDADRMRTIGILREMADRLETGRDAVLEILRRAEPAATAEDELEKTVRALRSYEEELPAISDRRPFGDVSVALPFNNPLYSLILYAVGPALGGSPVKVRPSSITAHQVADLAALLDQELAAIGVNVVELSGKEFLEHARLDPAVGSLIFTGSWDNLVRLRPTFPESKTLIYCGSGVSPFILAEDALDELSVAEAADLAVVSRLYNSGQDCLCSERFYLHESIADSFIDALIERLGSIRVGQFGDLEAEITPLLGGLDRHLMSLVEICSGEWIVPYRADGALVHPSVLAVDLGDPLLKTEKFGPVFVVAQFSSTEELEAELDCEYRFGATVCGAYDSPGLRAYPHVTRGSSVIAMESEDAHVPFGGCGRSGFVQRGSLVTDGPILYSVETTTPDS